MITQQQVDGVASYVEAADELAIEPFFDKEEQFTQSGSAEHKIVYQLGDRFHFRSALISYELHRTCGLCGDLRRGHDLTARYAANYAGGGADFE